MLVYPLSWSSQSQVSGKALLSRVSGPAATSPARVSAPDFIIMERSSGDLGAERKTGPPSSANAARGPPGAILDELIHRLIRGDPEPESEGAILELIRQQGG